jgi:hypothetical protein
MAKRTNTTTRRNLGTTRAASTDGTTADVMEQRVLAFAEQLGRIAGIVQAKAEGWSAGDRLKQELARVRDGAAELLEQLAGGPTAVEKKKPVAVAALKRTTGRSGGVVDAPGKKHRPPMATDPDASLADSQAAKMRAARTMVKTPRRRGRG